MRSLPQDGSHFTLRVGVRDLCVAEECAFFFQEFDDDGVRLEDGETFVRLAIGVHLAAGVVDEEGDGKAVILAGLEVVHAMRGGGVDCTGTLFGGDVVGEDAEDAAI